MKQLLIALLCLTLARGSQTVEIQQVRLEYRWYSLGSGLLRYQFIVQCNTLNICESEGSRWVDTPQGKKEICVSTKKPVDLSLLEKLYNASFDNLEPVSELVVELIRTDDYPNWRIVIKTATGISLLENASNGGIAIWNVRRNNQWFVQKGKTIQLAFAALLRIVDCQV